jgi:hypothetical protein
MIKKTTIIIPALLLATLYGCSWNRYQEVKDTNLIEASLDATDKLRDKLARMVPPHSLIVVSTLLNVDNLNQTSAFGRIVSDQIASAFHDAGHEIIGMEMPIDLFVMQEGGELALSGDTKAKLRKQQAAVLVGGVYAAGKKNTYVSLRVIDVFSKRVISTYDFSVPMGPDAKLLLEPRPVASSAPSTEPAGKIEDAGKENSAAPTNTETTPKTIRKPEDEF